MSIINFGFRLFNIDSSIGALFLITPVNRNIVVLRRTEYSLLVHWEGHSTCWTPRRRLDELIPLSRYRLSPSQLADVRARVLLAHLGRLPAMRSLSSLEISNFNYSIVLKESHDVFQFFPQRKMLPLVSMCSSVAHFLAQFFKLLMLYVFSLIACEKYIIFVEDKLAVRKYSDYFIRDLEDFIDRGKDGETPF